MSNGLEGRELLTAIVDMHERDGRPVKWIARSTGVAPRDINAVLKVAGYKSRDVHDLNTYDLIGYRLQEGDTPYRIQKDLGIEYRTIYRWFRKEVDDAEGSG